LFNQSDARAHRRDRVNGRPRETPWASEPCHRTPVLDQLRLVVPRAAAGGLGRIATIQGCGAPVSWERYLTLMLDGLRAR
jgi:hypothetical protein